jgi:OmpA-OmpF porin, OOP family
MNYLLSNTKNSIRFILLVFACVGCMQSYSQKKNDNPLQLANQSFAAGDYYTAAKLYEQYLNPSKKVKTKSDFPLNAKRNRQAVASTKSERTDILFKQAESYRLANYWQQASALYKECAAINPTKYADALYWHAVSERSLGNYSAAQQSINEYIGNTGGMYKDAAKTELQTLIFIQQQQARPDTVMYQVKKLMAPNSVEKGIFAPTVFNGNQFLITSTQTDSVQTAGVNPYHSRLFFGDYTQGALQTLTPVSLSADATMNQGAASMSADGKHLYFTQWAKQNGQTVSAIYHVTKQGSEWSKPELINNVNINGYSSKQPFCTSDGKFLFFASNRPGGFGMFDIWYAAINSDGSIGEPVNAGPMINTTFDEQAPFYHNRSNTLVFSSNGNTGMGGYDLLMSKGTVNAWGTSQNMGHPINSSRDDIYFFAAEQNSLLGNALISSDRGSECCLETYIISKLPKKQKLTGLVKDETDKLPVANAEVILKDARGNIWKQVTGVDGSYTFDLANDGPYSLTISKEYYKEKNTATQIETTDEQDWSTDIQKNKDEYIEKRVILKPETVVTVYFDFDKHNLKEEAVTRLDSVYNVLAETPGASLQISGYTDGLGTVEYNKVLSDKRARACAAYLIQKGIDSSRITFESFGACCPIEMELINGRDNEEGRAKNRRALINVVMPKQEY